MSQLLHFYRKPALPIEKVTSLRKKFSLSSLITESCFNIEVSQPLTENKLKKLYWLLRETFEPENFSKTSFLDNQYGKIIEVGPRMNFTTAKSTSTVSICQACGIEEIIKVEVSRRFLLPQDTHSDSVDEFIKNIHDRMTECVYEKSLISFIIGTKPEPVKKIDLLGMGEDALKEANTRFGLGMDEQDFKYYLHLFGNFLQRNPTDVELFQLAQANSEHCRHFFFRGVFFVDGKKMPSTLMELVKAPYLKMPGKSIIAFHDNSSSLIGFDVWTLLPISPSQTSPIKPKRVYYHPILTAETHNFPSGVAPFPGAETGTGGRIRDIQAVGRGGLMIAGTVGYCVGALRLPNYNLPWEHINWPLAENLAKPMDILIQTSNGASDYGNKIGEPLILGFTRSTEIITGYQRRAWLKPIMFTGGIGQMDSIHTDKHAPRIGDLIIILGGPNYRIGMGGGSASSMIQGENIVELDFSAVQRGDAEMEQKTLRVINACIAMERNNPIVTIHDLGAGGNCNAIPEGVDPKGAVINLEAFLLGDKTLSTREIWGNESQERYFIVINKERLNEFKQICQREKCPLAVVGKITGDGKIILFDSRDNSKPVDLNLKQIFGDVPQKKFKFTTKNEKQPVLSLPETLTFKQALERVLRVVSVGSKRFLTTKVDRSVSGLIIQQQCVGSLQLTMSDYALVINSHFQLTGIASSIGEQPIKELIDPKAMSRMSTGEALTNLMWVKISDFKDIRFSANWMWAAKLENEGARIYEAAEALSEFLLKLEGPVIDGGKDSLSMAVKVKNAQGKMETVKAPGALVISAYAPCPNVTKKVTPDIKEPGISKIMFIDLAQNEHRLGASALALVFEQVGDQSPDVDEPKILKLAFRAMQDLIQDDLILAGHDRSDGGLITCLLEMAFAGNCGLEFDFKQTPDIDWISFLFNEELGLVFEYLPQNEQNIYNLLQKYNLKQHSYILGNTTRNKKIVLINNGQEILIDDMRRLRDIWEETSYQLDKQQANPECVERERQLNFDRQGPNYNLNFVPQLTNRSILNYQHKPRVAILRAEGSNGDREMASAFYLAGFETWDVMMSDLMAQKISLEQFQGIAFVGGFSYADVLGASKGWAGVIQFNTKIKQQFDVFYRRSDTFSLGVCNGCQLMALLGWVPKAGLENIKQPRFIRNISGRFESRFVNVKILPSPAIMFKDMAESVLGIWVAHGEGHFYCPDKHILNKIIKYNLAPMRFVDDMGNVTRDYPFNPNGSPLGITALCSQDGRHLAMMPHPERLFLKHQWPYWPKNFQNLKASPWLKIFQNAREWVENIS